MVVAQEDIYNNRVARLVGEMRREYGPDITITTDSLILYESFREYKAMNDVEPENTSARRVKAIGSLADLVGIGY